MKIICYRESENCFPLSCLFLPVNNSYLLKKRPFLCINKEIIYKLSLLLFYLQFIFSHDVHPRCSLAVILQNKRPLRIARPQYFQNKRPLRSHAIFISQSPRTKIFDYKETDLSPHSTFSLHYYNCILKKRTLFCQMREVARL